MDQISVSTEEGFADIRFPLKSVKFGSDGTAHVSVEGDYKGKTIGLEILIKGQMRPGIVDGEIDRTAFYPKGILIRPSNSDGSITAMFASQYGVRSEPKPPVPEIELTCFALNGDPSSIATEHLNFKVFHDDEDVLGLYFEMYVHVDLPGRYVRFDEKDEEYRKNIVSTFGAASASGISHHLPS